MLGQVDAQGFDAAICEWLARHEGNLPSDLALDGKVLRGTTDSNGHRLSLVALIENNTQRLVAQQPMKVISDKEEDKQEGAPRPQGRGRDRQPKAALQGGRSRGAATESTDTSARRLLEEVPSLEGITVTGDAMFTHADVMQRIVQDKGGDYLLAIKDNQPKLHAQVQAAFAAKHQGAAKPHFFKTK